MARMNKEEKHILKSFDNEELAPVKNEADEIRRYQQIAKNTLKKDRRINIRLSGRDVDAIRAMAMEEGIPYQTFISSILHKFINGRIKEKA